MKHRIIVKKYSDGVKYIAYLQKLESRLWGLIKYWETEDVWIGPIELVSAGASIWQSRYNAPLIDKTKGDLL